MSYFKISSCFWLLLAPYCCFCAVSERDQHSSLLGNPAHFLKKNLKKVVYTCICGDYDALISHSYVRDSWDYICFTDNQEILKTGHHQWTIRPLKYAERDNTR